jgi:hypothetical protein
VNIGSLGQPPDLPTTFDSRMKIGALTPVHQFDPSPEPSTQFHSNSSDEGSTISTEPFQPGQEEEYGIENRSVQNRVSKASVSVFQQLQIFFKKLYWTKWRWLPSAQKHGEYAQKIEDARMAKLYEVLNLDLSGSRKIASGDQKSISKYDEHSLEITVWRDFKNTSKGKTLGILPLDEFAKCKAFAKAVLEIRDLLVGMQEGTHFTTTEEIQEKISAIAASTIYQELMATENAAVNFLQYLGHKLRMADGSTIYRDFANEQLQTKKSENGHSFAELGNSLDTYSKGSLFGVNKAKDWGDFWHGRKAKYDPLGYNSFHNNSSTAGYTFQQNGKVIRFLNTPGITGDNLYEFVLLPLYKKLYMTEVRFNYQDSTKKAEATRITEVDRIAGKSDQHLKHVVLGHNKKIKENKKIIHDCKTVAEFIEKQKQYYANILPEKQFNQIFAPQGPIHTLFSETVLNEMSKSDKEVLALAIQYAIDAAISAAIIYLQKSNVIDENGVDEDLRNGACYITGACVQNQDRAPGHNLMTYLFHRALNNNGSLTNDEYAECVGTVIGRPEIDANRKPNKHVRGAIYLAKHLGQNGTDKLNEAMNAFRQTYLDVQPPLRRE